MKVRELMHALAKLPQDAEIKGVYDGASRLEVGLVWLAQSGDVLLGCSEDCYLYYEEDFPPEGQMPEIDRRA